MKLKKIAGDGNCLFRAIADQHAGNESLHVTYRDKAVEYIRTNKDAYVHFILDDKTPDQYCDWMAKDRVWGGNIEMNALGMSMKFNLIIH